jgi:hypothetical protein
MDGVELMLTKATLDKAIASGQPILVRCEGSTFAFTVTAYNRRVVYGHYNNKIDSAFHRADLESI